MLISFLLSYSYFGIRCNSKLFVLHRTTSRDVNYVDRLRLHLWRQSERQTGVERGQRKSCDVVAFYYGTFLGYNANFCKSIMPYIFGTKIWFGNCQHVLSAHIFISNTANRLTIDEKNVTEDLSMIASIELFTQHVLVIRDLLAPQIPFEREAVSFPRFSKSMTTFVLSVCLIVWFSVIALLAAAMKFYQSSCMMNCTLCKLGWHFIPDIVLKSCSIWYYRWYN